LLYLYIYISDRRSWQISTLQGAAVAGEFPAAALHSAQLSTGQRHSGAVHGGCGAHGGDSHGDLAKDGDSTMNRNSTRCLENYGDLGRNQSESIT